MRYDILTRGSIPSEFHIIENGVNIFIGEVLKIKNTALLFE